jgi:hypothetical protein
MATTAPVPVHRSPLRIFLAGDWHNPPLETAAALKAAGYTFTADWWNQKATYKMNIELLRSEVYQCDAYVLDMRSSRFNSHHFGGSMLGLGMAVGFGKEVIVLIPDSAEKPYTSLVLPYTTKSMDEALRRLQSRQHINSYCTCTCDRAETAQAVPTETTGSETTQDASTETAQAAE